MDADDEAGVVVLDPVAADDLAAGVVAAGMVVAAIGERPPNGGGPAEDLFFSAMVGFEPVWLLVHGRLFSSRVETQTYQCSYNKCTQPETGSTHNVSAELPPTHMLSLP